eukprot:CAMPEP_0197639230 /NCGR_PEP_ID=MMETSP1338-20131121/13913_1 /TAXON_ID=43686 ORGANISM="Pelagodinium beii, Strain RCC1491" /NCGR_SAMPLE_ID=MMETSP1338 /ASSEMBLY_ACC=CAM_ASM_000754 /LENGTH=370 /DNA_ID=CAMNT_0043211927 /DNA_START=36 /DNA_END=1148 /DNA_ORIENTATION=-
MTNAVEPVKPAEDGSMEPPEKKHKKDCPTPTFGDVMPSKLSPFRIPSTFSRRERLVLTANGNLQRLISSYYNSPVTVTVEYNRATGKGRYERLVTLTVFGIKFAQADSTVTLEREDCIEAVEKKGIGIGQLFRHFEVLPTFQLLEASKAATGAFDRTYTLTGRGICCVIHESFPVADLFALKPPPGAAGGSNEQPTKHLGDIMSPNQTGLLLPDGDFEPMQRVLLTANGNVHRLVSSFYYPAEVNVNVIFSHKNEDGSYDRQTCMSIFGEQFMTARSAIHLMRDDYIDALASGVPLGGLYQHMGVLPTFILHSVGKVPASKGGKSYIWRVYTLRTEGMSCEIHEKFSDSILTEKFRSESPERSPAEHVHF